MQPLGRRDIVARMWRRLLLLGLLVSACTAHRASAPQQPPPVRAASTVPPASPAPAPPALRLRLCTEEPVRLEGPPGAPQSRGCVVTFRQHLTDRTIIEALGATDVERRALVYVPANLPPRPAPVVLVFPGYSSSAEVIAFYQTHTRFEALADRDGFIVVYGNGLPNPPDAREHVSTPKGGFFSGCMAPHHDEGVDVAYVRELVDRLGAELPIDRARIYATGISAGGGMSFELAIEAPDLVAAIAPVVPIPFQPTGGWLLRCHPKPGYAKVSVAMVAATSDSFITYEGGGRASIPRRITPAWSGCATSGSPRSA